MSGYWIDDDANPFNQMSWTRGGGGYDNSGTHKSNELRSEAMEGAGAAALPHFANAGVAAASTPGLSYVVVGDNVLRVDGRNAPGSGPGVGQAATGSGDTSGPGAGAVASTSARTSGAGSSLVINSGGLKTTDLFVGGRKLAKDEGTSDGGDFEDRWGEWGGAIAGIGVMLSDHWQILQEYNRASVEAEPLRGGGGFDRIVKSWGEMVQQNSSARLRQDGVVVKTGGGF
ncbi:hypothetical protein [Devosia chinhatensis]|uniref:Uncharacterized protein n=1 Tax=Devosia chinhatensis TaxID=429727 RepID=A0A0F5FL62_9HYPH|nr:hypothetical protein [Devosia chinhatensis]KKB09523.1 hypothetical protein VE26_06350 [Devosia chinhatensis]